MSGTLPSNADGSADADGSGGTDRDGSEAAGSRTDGGAAAGSDTSESESASADPVAAETDAGASEIDSPPTDIEEVSAGAAGDGDRAASTDDDGNVRICWLNDDGADALIGALAPQTARAILGAVHEEPRTASELADAADTSVQNVRHHVQKLGDAGLVETVDTRYSVKGREMTVYGPADDRVVVAVGGESERSSLLDSLRGLLGAVAVLAGASLLVQALFGAGAATVSGPETAPRIGDAVGATGGAVLGTIPPGAAFLAGGLLVLTTVLVAERLRRR
ncbi:winged helix-turn-helix domain-containing protein [Halobaculum gomorrense]|uniref:Helix-turn-helix domain-containing protein n=1 Tax=Halobaculum gomorrense TaxID=43928 RepID=A0A1M5R929_9EURY|nr:winged helix-turn-helix domain-containing protein [Halobaculum gomorrense]SHH22741.1 Helix-turn-helix domain-containing protein [Halobaculum gomorrense]